MNTKAVCGVVVAGIVGAILWYLLNQDLEKRYIIIAVGLGAGIGFAGVRLGGYGDWFGLVCAVVTGLSIVAGEVAVVNSWVGRAIEDAAEEEYLELQSDAEAYERVDTEKKRRGFMARRGYSDSKSASRVTDEELEYFELEIVPVLEEIRSGEITAKDWSQRMAGETSAWATAWSLMGPLEGLLCLLGLIAAYTMVKKLGDGE